MYPITSGLKLQDKGELNKKRFMDFGKQAKKAAAFAFAGDTYKGLDIEKMNQNDLEWAQEHLRLSLIHI